MKTYISFESEVPSIDYKCIPFLIDEEHRPYLLDDQSNNRFQIHLKEISEELGNSNFIRKKWRNRCLQEAKYRFANIYWSLRRKKFSEAYKELRHMILSPENKIIELL